MPYHYCQTCAKPKELCARNCQLSMVCTPHCSVSRGFCREGATLGELQGRVVEEQVWSLEDTLLNLSISPGRQRLKNNSQAILDKEGTTGDVSPCLEDHSQFLPACSSQHLGEEDPIELSPSQGSSSEGLLFINSLNLLSTTSCFSVGEEEQSGKA